MDPTIPTTIAHGFNHGQWDAINVHQKKFIHVISQMDPTIPTTIAHGFNHGQLNAINMHQKNLSMSYPKWIQPFPQPLPMVLTMGN
jgi:hypothetical protein